MRFKLSSIVVALLTFAAAAPAAWASPPQAVTLELNGHLTSPSTVEGFWQADGAFTDAGTYTESLRFAGRSLHVSKTLVGVHGTLHLRAETVVVWLSPSLAAFKAGSWRIISGTGAYRHLHAGGTPVATADSFGDLATGLVHIEHVGEVR